MKAKYLLVALLLGLLLLVMFGRSIVPPPSECFISYRYELDGTIRKELVPLDDIQANILRHAFNGKRWSVNWNSGESPDMYDDDYGIIFKYPLGIAMKVLLPIVEETRSYGFNGTFLELKLDEAEHDAIMGVVHSFIEDTGIVTR